MKNPSPHKSSLPVSILRCFWDAAATTIRHDGIEHAGYLAFLGLLAMFPFLVFVVAVIGFIGQGALGANFINELLLALPTHVADGIRPRITEIISGPPQGLLTVSILGAIWTASSAVEGLRTILNRAYHVATPPAYWLRRSLSVLQLLLFTSLLITGMLLLVLIPLSLRRLQEWTGIQLPADFHHSWSFIAIALTVAVLFGVVSYMYYIIPNIRQRLLSIAPGAAIVVALWLGSARLFTLYLSHFDQVNLIYGSLGGIIAALLFFYICNLIFIFGAEFNYQVVYRMGMRVIPKEETST